VVLKQFGNSLKSEPRRVQFRHEFAQMVALVQQHSRPLGFAIEQFLPRPGLPMGPAAQDAQLAEQQLSHILETAASQHAVNRQMYCSKRR
jgi:hypothetical protein